MLHSPEPNPTLKNPSEQELPMPSAEARLKDLGIALPTPSAPVANYAPFVAHGGVVYVAGQISRGPEGVLAGRLGADLDLAAGQAAARLCAINLMAQMKAACDGDLDRVARVLKLGGFVNATADFVDIPQVVNGCSDLIVAVFGEAGRHARSAVACPTLPLGAAVEVDCVFAMRA
jgi:enamine deaminase RidA (YjgF/YER057c/UK114 family)